jgi:hypothetical protein
VQSDKESNNTQRRERRWIKIKNIKSDMAKKMKKFV